MHLHSLIKWVYFTSFAYFNTSFRNWLMWQGKVIVTYHHFSEDVLITIRYYSLWLLILIMLILYLITNINVWSILSIWYNFRFFTEMTCHVVAHSKLYTVCEGLELAVLYYYPANFLQISNVGKANARTDHDKQKKSHCFAPQPW